MEDLPPTQAPTEVLHWQAGRASSLVNRHGSIIPWRSLNTWSQSTMWNVCVLKLRSNSLKTIVSESLEYFLFWTKNSGSQYNLGIQQIGVQISALLFILWPLANEDNFSMTQTLSWRWGNHTDLRQPEFLNGKNYAGKLNRNLLEGHYRAQRISHRRVLQTQASTCFWLMPPGVRSTQSSSEHLFLFQGATGNPREATALAQLWNGF